MPHKCTRCGKVYQEGDERVLQGCECGNRLFIYFRKLSSQEAEEAKKKGAKKSSSKELREIVKGIEEDIWNIKVKNGVYQIDVASLMSREPIIVEGDEGEYLVSLSSLFEDKKGIRKYLEFLRR